MQFKVNHKTSKFSTLNLSKPYNTLYHPSSFIKTAIFSAPCIHTIIIFKYTKPLITLYIIICNDRCFLI